MKLNCKIIEDLLPLYLDNVCSDETKRMVEEHLNECEECRKLIGDTQTVRIPHIEPEKSTADRAVKKSFKKIRTRWWVSVIAAVILVPVLLLAWNQYNGSGVSFTNIHELYIANAFMNDINEGNYKKAYSYVDVEGLKTEWTQNWFDEEKLENIKADGLAKFCEYGEKLEEQGGIKGYEYVGISLHGYDNENNPVYQIVFKVEYAGEESLFDIIVSDDGVEYFGGNGSFTTDVLAQFSIWSEYLWQEYEGCYFDPELNEYIYEND